MPAGSHTSFLNESERPTRRHYPILAMCWAGRLFEIYDLMLFGASALRTIPAPGTAAWR